MVPNNVFYIVSLFDGSHSILDIQAKYTQRYGDLLFSDNVQKIIQKLDESLFLENKRFEDHIKKIKEGFKKMTLRKAVHAGTAYEADKEKLKNQIDELFTSPDGPGKPSSSNNTSGLKGIIAPHIDIRMGDRVLPGLTKRLPNQQMLNSLLFLVLHILAPRTSLHLQIKPLKRLLVL